MDNQYTDLTKVGAHSLSDLQFIAACNELESQPDLFNKILFFHTLENELNSMFYIRTIEGKEYEWGIRIQTKDELQVYANWYYNKYCIPILKVMRQDLLDRLNKCVGIGEMEDLLDQELKNLETKMFNNSILKYGFESERAKESPYVESSYSLKDIKVSCMGSVVYKYHKIITDILNSHKEDKVKALKDTLYAIEEEGESITPTLKKQHKFVLLAELGIINYLDEKFNIKRLKQADQIKLLSLILGLDAPEDRSTLKRCLTSYQLPNNDIMTTNALNQVRAALASVGLPF